MGKLFERMRPSNTLRPVHSPASLLLPQVQGKDSVEGQFAHLELACSARQGKVLLRVHFNEVSLGRSFNRLVVRLFFRVLFSE